MGTVMCQIAVYACATLLTTVTMSTHCYSCARIRVFSAIKMGDVRKSNEEILCDLVKLIQSNFGVAFYCDASHLYSAFLMAYATIS